MYIVIYMYKYIYMTKAPKVMSQLGLKLKCSISKKERQLLNSNGLEHLH